MEDYEVINMSSIPVIETGFEEFYILGFLGSQTGRALMSRLVGPAGKAVELSKNSTHLLWRYQGDPTWIEWVALADITGAAGKNPEFQRSSTHIQWRLVGNTEWTNLVALSDIKGDPGASPEFQKTATHIQWRLVGSPDWISLVPLSDIKGDPGKNFTIIANYATEAALRSAVPAPAVGDVYSVGESAPYNIYVYDLILQDWKNYGPIQGAAGASSYAYIAYASNDQGADFSLTDGAYIAIKTTTEPIANPVADDFEGLWKHYKVTAAEVAAGIEIGGRNYIKNSEIKTLTGWNSYGTTLSIVDDSLRIVGTSEFVGVSTIYAVALNAQREVTISFYAKNNKDSACDINLFPNGNNPIYVGTLPNNSAWVRLSKTFIPAPYQVDKVNSIGTHIYTTGSIDLQIKYVKIEYGNKVTDWTPAPEDSAIREVDGKVAVGNNTPLANLDWAGSSVSRGDVYTYRDVVSKYLGTGTITGAVVITLPHRTYDPMITVVITGFEYSTGSWEVIVSGYWNAGINTWSTSKVEVKGVNPFGDQIRIGYSESLPVIVLGSTSSSLSFASVKVLNVNIYFSGETQFGSGWTITQVTDLTGYTLVTPTTHTYIHSGNIASQSVDNAAKLGGVEASKHISGNNIGATTYIHEGNPNDINKSGFYYLTSVTANYPPSGIHGRVIHIAYNGVSGYAAQIWIAATTNQVYFRVQDEGTWLGWREFFHSSNLDPSLLTFLTSQSTVTTLASLPVTKRVIVASVTAATTLSLAAALEVGRELHIKVYNTSASAITQPLPTSAPFESKKTDGTNISSISIPAGGSVEISILSVTDKYIIKTDA